MWISIVVAVGAFIVAAESIYLGYLLFIAGAGGSFKFTASSNAGTVGFESVAPGIALALFGACLAAWTVHRLIAKD